MGKKRTERNVLVGATVYRPHLHGFSEFFSDFGYNTVDL